MRGKRWCFLTARGGAMVVALGLTAGIFYGGRGQRAWGQAATQGSADHAWADFSAQLVSRNSDAAVAGLLLREQSGLPLDAPGLMALADDWEGAQDQLAEADQWQVAPHIVDLYQQALKLLRNAPLRRARQRLAAVEIALANRQLNHLGAWHVDSGKWATTKNDPPRIEGRGDSSLTANAVLPGNCGIEFHVKPLQGMRTRILLQGTGLSISNEGQDRHFEVFGATSCRAVPMPYVDGDDLVMRMKFAGRAFEFYVNGELMAKGRCGNNPPREIRMVLRAGDGWDGGITQFWGFKVTAADQERAL